MKTFWFILYHMLMLALWSVGMGVSVGVKTILFLGLICIELRGINKIYPAFTFVYGIQHE